MKYPILLSVFILGGCASNTGTGVITGTILGSSVGGIAGGGGGALIGTVAGAIAGGLVGASLDSQDRKIMEYRSPRTVDRMDRGDALTLSDIIKLSQNGVSDETIINYIHDTASSYQLSQPQLRRLQDAGVSPRVINEMILSGR